MCDEGEAGPRNRHSPRFRNRYLPVLIPHKDNEARVIEMRRVALDWLLCVDFILRPNAMPQEKPAVVSKLLISLERVRAEFRQGVRPWCYTIVVMSWNLKRDGGMCRMQGQISLQMTRRTLKSTPRAGLLRPSALMELIDPVQ